MTTALRTTGARLVLLLTLVTALTVLLVAGASAQSDDCYPIPADGCEEPEVEPSVINTPTPTNPAPVPSTSTQPPPPQLADTGLESSTLAFLAGGLVLVGGGAILAGRRRESTDA